MEGEGGPALPFFAFGCDTSAPDDPEAKSVASTSEDLAAAMAAHQGGDLAGAESLYRQVIRRAPDNAEALHLLGVIHFQRQQHDEAIRLIRKAIGRNPRKAEYHTNLSLSLRDSEQFEEALEAAKKAVALKPDFAEAHANHGLALMALRRPEDAIESFKRAIALKPNVAGFHNNLGNAYRGLAQYPEAEGSHRAALAINPRHIHAMLGLGIAIDEQGRLEEALEVLGDLLKLDPGNGEAHGRMGSIMSRRGLVRDALEHLQKAMDADSDDIRPLLMRIFLSNALEEITARDMLDRASAFADNLAGRTERRPVGNSPDPDRVIRVGFVSGDLQHFHPVGAFTRGFLGEIDREQFRLTAYNTGGHGTSFSKFFDLWREVEDVKPQALAELVRMDKIDILIDLSGYTDGARPGVFAAKPAPIQAVWLGYSGTTGSRQVDYIVADKLVIPKSDEAYYSETPLRLPDSYLCWTPPDDEVSIVPPPAIAAGYITFGSFNNVRKVSNEAARTWARVLKAVPQSRLVLKYLHRPDQTVIEHIASAFESEGVDPQRIVILDPKADQASHFAAYGDIDIALDTFPYNGTTTTVEALWMGVPVLTVKGGRFIARVSESINRTVGLDDWVAEDVDDYVRKAAAFAADRPALAALRSRLRDRLISSPLCDAPRFARNFESALRGVWRDWCARQTDRKVH